VFPSPTQNPPKTLKNSHGLAGKQGVQRSWSTARLRTSAVSCTRGPAARPMLLLRSACDGSHVFPTAVSSTKRPQSQNKKISIQGLGDAEDWREILFAGLVAVLVARQDM
jgi:hypothetical protein